MDTQKNKIIIIAVLLGLLFVSVIGYIAYPSVRDMGKVRVEISLAPTDADFYINDKLYPQRVGFFEPGEYKVKAVKGGYRTHEETIRIHKEQKEYVIPISLIPESAGALAESDRYQDLYLKNEGLAGKQAQSDGIIFRANNPIVKRLPYKTMLYTIGYQADKSNPSGIIITIDAPEGLRDDVVAQIERWGYDPTTLNIVFRKYENPFES